MNENQMIQNKIDTEPSMSIVANAANQEGSVGFYFKIYGLPAKFDETALKIMFNNVKFLRIVTSTPTPITSTNNNNGQTEQITTLKAKKLCQVETQLDLERALTRQDERVGKSKLQIFQISRSEFDREIANLNKNNHYNTNNNNINNNNNYQSNDYNESNGQDYQDQMVNADQDQVYNENNNNNSWYIYMHGVPFSAKEQDVRFFFQGIQIQSVSLLIDNQTQKPTGECCCQFATKMDRDRALEKDDQLFRNRVVKVKSINFNEFLAAQAGKLRPQFIKQQQRNNYINNNNNTNNNGNNNSGNHSNKGIKSIMSLSPNEKAIPSLFHNSNSPNDNSNEYSNVNSSENDDQNTDYFDSNSNEDSEQYNNNNRKFNNNNNNNNNRNIYQRQFNNINNDNNNGVKRRANNLFEDQSNNGNKRVKNFIQPRYNQSYNNNNNDNESSFDNSEPAVLPPLPPELQKYRNRLVLFSNISYQASREDILELVRQFSPMEQTLKIRHDDSGQPAGDAVVACLTSDNAVNACLTLNGAEFMGRNIKATLFSS